jgi:HPt (histidine-containing phosphotransfer) domain-containing protein
MEIGVDVDSVISRLGGNEKLYHTICHKFLKDQNFRLFRDSIEERNTEAATIYIHTLKGVSANLGFLYLEQICRNILADLKNNDISVIKQLVSELDYEYNKIVNVLNQID